MNGSLRVLTERGPASLLLVFLALGSGYQILHLEMLTRPDSFRYVWEHAEINKYFFQASSQSVRAIFYLLGNDLKLIGAFHVLLRAAALALLFFCIRTDRWIQNLAYALLLACILWSDKGVWYAHAPLSESVFASFLLIFTVLLWGYRWRYRSLLLVTCGVVFIFSRNVAPFVAIAEIVLFLLLARRIKYARAALPALSVLVLASALAIYNVHCCDTTKQINAADNILSRILPYPEKVALFVTKYHMPTGPFLTTCVGYDANVNSPCFDHQIIYTGDYVTRQYRVTDDEYGFSDWIRDYGPGAWVSYLFVDAPAETWTSFREGLEKHAHRFAALDKTPGGLIFHALDRLLTLLRGLVLEIDLVYIAVLAALALAAQRPGLIVGTALIGVGLLGSFLGYFGDSEEIDRYLHPPLLAFYIGHLIVLVELVAWLLEGRRDTTK